MSNIRYITGVSSYNVNAEDDIINVDTSAGAVTIVLPNIQGSGLLTYGKNFTINDSTGQAFTNNITIVATNNIVNSGIPTKIQIAYGTASVFIVNVNEYQVITDNPSGGGGGSNIYTGASPSTVTVENIPAGTVITGYTYDQLLGNIYAPYTSPTIAFVSLSPASPQPYNEQNVACSVVFSWTPTAGTPNLTSAQVQFQRQGDLTWTNITTITNVPLPTISPVQATGTVTVNTSGVNNTSVLFRCIFIDAQTNTSSTATLAFSPYVAPTAIITLNPTPSLTSGKMIRALISPTTSVGITGTITRNSQNINMSTYKIQRSYDNSTYTDLTSALASTNPVTTITPLTDNTQPTNQNNYYVRAYVVDSQNTPTGAAVSAVSSFGIYQPVFFGMTTASSIGAVNLNTLSVVPNGASNTGGQVNYSNTSADKVIAGLNFTANNDRFCYAYDSSYGTVTSFFYVQGNTNLFGNFITGTQAITFADGSVITYRIYLYNLVVTSGTYTINVS